MADIENSRRTLLAGLVTAGLASCAAPRQLLEAPSAAGWLGPEGRLTPYCGVDGEAARSGSDGEVLMEAARPCTAPPGGKADLSTLGRMHTHIGEFGLAAFDACMAPVWPDRDSAPDYLHLARPARDDAEFVLTPAVLASLARVNGFRTENEPVVLFGLRGCVATDWARTRDQRAAVQMKVARPNHITPQCAIGIWDRRNANTQTISVFKASTVASAFYMREQVAMLGLINCGARVPEHYYRRANMLACGFYRYERGAHGTSKAKCIPLRWAGGDPPPGGTVQKAFRAEYSRGKHKVGREDLVLRTVSKLSFSSDQIWDVAAAYNNLHPARTASIAHWSPETQSALNRDRAAFSSAGCQVIDGDDPDGDRSDSWKTFRDRVYAAPTQTSYPYMLLTGDEACIAAWEGARYLNLDNERVRVGSQSPGSERIRSALKQFPVTNPLSARNAYDALNACKSADLSFARSPAFPVATLDQVVAAIQHRHNG